MCQGSQYIRVLNMSGFIKKTQHHKDGQGSDYSLGSAYFGVPNIPGLRKVLEKKLHHRYLTRFQTFFRF